MDLLLTKRRKARAELDDNPDTGTHLASFAQGQIAVIDIVLNDLGDDPKKKPVAKFLPYSDEQVARLKVAPKFIVNAVHNGTKVDSVLTAVLHLILGRVKLGNLTVTTHVIEKEWPDAVEALYKPCTPGTVSRRFRELQDLGYITVSEVKNESAEGWWKIERIYGWPVRALGEQDTLF